MIEAAGGDLSGWPLWQAIAALAALFLVPSVLSAWIARRHGAVESVAWALACVAAQFALVFGAGFVLLGYGPS